MRRLTVTHEGGENMFPITWAKTMKVTALTTAGRQSTTVVRTAVDLPWSWNPREVWLSRARQPRARVTRAVLGAPSRRVARGRRCTTDFLGSGTVPRPPSPDKSTIFCSDEVVADVTIGDQSGR